MKSTTVALGSRFDEFVQASILGGRYTNVSEVIRADIRDLEEDEHKIAGSALPLKKIFFIIRLRYFLWKISIFVYL